MQIEWKRKLQIAEIVLMVYLGFRYLLPFALPFLLAWVIAGVLYPAGRFFEIKLHIKRNISGAILFALILLFALLLLFLGLRELFLQGKAIVEGIPRLEEWGSMLLKSGCRQLEKISGIRASESEAFFLAQTGKWENKIVSAIGRKTASCMAAGFRVMLYFASGILLTYILSVLMLSDMEKLQRAIRETKWLQGGRHVIDRLGETVLTYLKAQFVIMFLVSAVCAAGFWYLKNPYFLLLGIFIGALDMLPLIGTGTFLYPAALFFLLRGERVSAVVCVLLDILTSVLREFLEPRLLGNKLGISPILVLASVYGGIFLYGVAGVVLGPLSFSTVYEIGKECDLWE